MDPSGCTWIPWSSKAMQKVPDPTRVFSLLVIGIMIFRYVQAQDWDASVVFSGFVGHPLVVVFFATAMVTVYFGYDAKIYSALPLYDRWAAEWYWWNAWLYHATMDGSSGSLQLVPLVVHQYQVLDYRFVNHDVMPWTIGVIELTMHYPLALLTLYFILQKHPLQFPFEIITSCFHLFGAIAFIVGELFQGQVHIPAQDPVGENGYKLNLYHFTYYWFGFWFCNTIWIIVPYYRMKRACIEIHRAFVAADKLKSR